MAQGRGTILPSVLGGGGGEGLQTSGQGGALSAYLTSGNGMISETPHLNPFPSRFPSDAHSGRELQVKEHSRKKMPNPEDPEDPDFPVSKPLSPERNILTGFSDFIPVFLFFLSFFWGGGGAAAGASGGKSGRGGKRAGERHQSQ